MLVLDKGLKYANFSHRDKFELHIDVNKFVRKLQIQRFFAAGHEQAAPRANINAVTDPINTSSIQHTSLRNKSLFNPNIPNGAIEVFKNLVQTDLDKLPSKEKKTKKDIIEYRAVKSLKEKGDLIITPADKGGGLVLLSKESYISELNQQLNDTTTYLRLKGDPLARFKKELLVLLEDGKQKGILTNKEYKYLALSNPKTPYIYQLPKIHKNSEKPPGRPIVSGILSITSRLGQYVDTYLQPLVVQLPAYLRDSNQLLNKLNEYEFRTGSFLVTADVSSLYTIIPQSEAIKACQHYLSIDNKLTKTQQAFILQALSFCLNHNYFWFQGAFYLQLVGVAMGGRFAPSVANLFMGLWESTTIFGTHRSPLTLWHRYIDDCFFIWEGDESSLITFMQELNANNLNIKLTYHHSLEAVDFLDLTIFVADGKLQTRTFFKPTDKNGYIPVDSHHHTRWINNIPKSQFMRIRKNCTQMADFESQAVLLKSRFLDKGYQESILDKTISEVKKLDRDVLLKGRKEKSDENTVKHKKPSCAFITKFHSNHKKTESIMKRHWHVLRSDPILGPLLPNRPVFTYRKAQNLNQQISQKILDPPKIPKLKGKGFHRCGVCIGCRTTGGLKPAVFKYKSHVTNVEFECKPATSCGTKNVIYLLQCPCGLQYVGRTKRLFKIRLSEHVRNIRKGILTHSVSAHYKTFHQCDPSNLIYLILEVVGVGWRGGNLDRKLAQREMFWLYNLKTLQPLGLNVETDLNCFIDDS